MTEYTTHDEPERREEEERAYREEEIERHDERIVPPARVSWGAIFAGTVVALAISFVLSLLGAAIGLSAFDPTQGAAALQEFDAAAGIWLIAQIFVSLFIGGWTAGRLAGKPGRLDGVLNGGVVWALTILLALFGFTGVVANAIGGMTGMTQEGMAAAEGIELGQVSTALWWTLLAIVLGLLAACLGGWVGSPKAEAWHERREERGPERVTGRGGRRPTPAE